MEINIQSIHFNITEKLQAFIDKKLDKLNKSYEEIQSIEIILKVEKPTVALNKIASISVKILGNTLFVEKKCSTFEESLDLCIDSIKVQLGKIKSKQRGY